MTWLIIAEKPSVAGKIANAIGRAQKKNRAGVPYYEVDTPEGRTYVAPSVGHVYSLQEKENKKWNLNYPVFDIEWDPIYEVQKGSAYTKGYINNIKELAKDADEYVNACDYDIEGCLPDYEEIIIKDQKGTEVTEIGNFIDKLLGANKDKVKNYKGFEYIDVEGIQTMSLDTNNLDLNYYDVKKVMRRANDPEILKIKLEHGREIRVSKNHPVFTLTKSGIEVKKAAELKENEYLPIVLNLPRPEVTLQNLDLIEELHRRGLDNHYVYGARDLVGMPAETSKILGVSRKLCLNWRFWDRMPLWAYLKLEKDKNWRKKLKIASPKAKHRIPAIINLDFNFGKLLGLYLAEGCIDTSGFIGLYFGGHENELADETEDLFNSVFGITKIKKRQYEATGQMGTGQCFEVGTKSKIIRFLFEDILALGKNSHKKRLPTGILSMPWEFTKGVLDGYFLGDGSAFISKKDNRLIMSAGSVSRKLMDDLHLLLLSFGINSSLVSGTKSSGANNYLHIGIDGELKKAIKRGVAEKVFYNGLAGSNHQKTESSALTKLPNFTLSDCKVSAQTKKNMKRSERVQISSIKEPSDFVSKIIKSKVHFLKVSAIEPLKYGGYLYDLQTETGSFMQGNGVITHNSVIGYNVLKHACGVDPKKDKVMRMHFSTVTAPDLAKAYNNLEDFDFGQTEAGLTRHALDWYYGINLSRALTSALHSSNTRGTLSIGRVQGPALKLIVDKEREIKAFVPTPFWVISALLNKEKDFDAVHVKEKFKKEDYAQAAYEKVRDEKTGRVKKVDRRRYKQPPPNPFDLTSLQIEAHRHHRIAPKQTLEIGQTLYENGYISYPRTSSQQLPPAIGYKTLLQRLASQDEYREGAQFLLNKASLKPNNGKKTDPAHPAIYPTGETPRGLGEREMKVYDLIVRRFLATFGEWAIRESMKAIIAIGGEDFKAEGKRTVEKNWHELYGKYAKFDEIILPNLKEGEDVTVKKTLFEKKMTQPPKRYTESSIISELEKRNLGTKATRASIIDTLFKRNYIRGKPLEATALGIKTVETLEKESPEILDENLTRQIEEEMEGVTAGKESGKKIEADARKILTSVLARFKKDEREIGEKLRDSSYKAQEQKVMAEALGKCPECGEGMLVVRKNPKTKKRFLGCSNYPKCTNTQPLPQKGMVKAANKECPECGYPMANIFTKGKKTPWTICTNINCASKKK